MTSNSFLLLLLWILWRVYIAITTYYVRRPKQMTVGGAPTTVGQWYTGIAYNFIAPKLIRDAYAKAKGKAFAVPSFSAYRVFITSLRQIDEVYAAPTSVLSFHEALHEMIFPIHVFNGFDFDPKDPRSAVPLHALQTQLKAHLPAMRPALRKTLQEAFRIEFVGPRREDGWTVISPHKVAHRIIGRLNNQILVGEELASDEDYLEAAMKYSQDTIVAGEILRVTPKFLHTYIAYVIMHWRGAQDKVVSRLTVLIETRMSEGMSHKEKPRDFVQWMIDATRKKYPGMVDRLVQHVLWLLFASVNQMPMLISFTLFNLCKYPEYIDPLMKEIKNSNILEGGNDVMPLLDSFLKETSRLQPPAILTMPRKVVRPFTFANGSHVPKNNWICIPTQAIMRDEANYTSPLKFEGFRFVSPDGSVPENQKFEVARNDFPYWGGVKKPCVGRFYVSVLVKMFIAYFLSSYEFKFEDETAPETFSWDFAVVPHPKARLLVKEK